MIKKSDPAYSCAMRLMEAAEEFRTIFPEKTAVRWLEDSSGRLIVFTRGEYKEAIRRTVSENLKPEETFEEMRVEREGWEDEP